MIGRRSIIGIAVLCAAAFSAIAVANASAAQRAWSCQNIGVSYKDPHCTTFVGTGGSFSRINNIENGKATKITGTNAKTASETTAAAPSILKGALSGVETELQCTGLSGTGELTNAEASVSGTGVITYTGCSVTKPSGKGCKVNEAKVVTKKLAATTVGQAANNLKFTPNEGTEFASIKIESCSNEALNNTFPVTGSLVATTSGATTTTTHAGITTQNTLKFGGVKAGLEGSLTISMEGGDPIVLE